MKPSVKSPYLLPCFTNQTSIKGAPYHRHPSSQHFSTVTAHSHVCLPTLNMTLSKTGNINSLISSAEHIQPGKTVALMGRSTGPGGIQPGMCDLEHLQVRLRSQDNFDHRIEFN